MIRVRFGDGSVRRALVASQGIRSVRLPDGGGKGTVEQYLATDTHGDCLCFFSVDRPIYVVTSSIRFSAPERIRKGVWRAWVTGYDDEQKSTWRDVVIGSFARRTNLQKIKSLSNLRLAAIELCVSRGWAIDCRLPIPAPSKSITK